ncbi:MAG: hypothetical protein LQ337_005571 [Flavoplaca oasis]|nr:MAG: hypothetical protein LQ337_005571 [Flavoplaca oasis]
MPGPHKNSKLLKNPNHLKEAVDHLRPRGSYDPLPPPGGFPLPHYIRRKFSFAPQLPNVSKISLMPDFASSSLDLGIEIDDSEARGISFDTPISLWVRYSLESLRERNANDRKQLSSRPTLLRLDTSLSSSNKLSRYDRDTTVEYPSYNHQYQQYPDLRRSRSIRRSRGQESLRRTSTTSSTESEFSSTGDTVGLNALSSTTITPRTALSFADDKLHHFIHTDEVESRLVKRLAEVIPNLFGSFCIIDLQLPGYPIRVTSHDMLPADLASDEVLFLDSTDMGTPYQVKTVTNRSQKLQILPIVADLVDIHSSSTKASHLVVGQVDLTEYVSQQEEPDEDVWLTIAYEEMDKAGVRQTYPRPGFGSPNVMVADGQAEQGIQILRSLHRDYFIIGMSDSETKEFGITMVSPTLQASKEIRGKDFLDFPSLSSRLNTPQRFVTRVKWQTVGQRDKVYCVPMSGPHLVCWLCFLVSNDLPDLWP